MGGLIPRSGTDKLVFSIFLLGGHLYLWYEMNLVLPFYNLPILQVIIHYTIAAWTYFQILANIFRMRFANSAGDPALRASKYRPFWKWCEWCQSLFPPRSHHCKLCGSCILRRDHHCWFAGCCVGTSNYQYYVVAIGYIWFAAIYGNVINFVYVGETLGGFGLWSLFCVCAPHVAALTGQLSALQIFVSVMTTIAYLVSVLTTWLLVIQALQIRDGQTKFERSKGIQNYKQRSLDENVRATLGSRWLLIWVWPWTNSEITDDGMSYDEVTDKTK